MKITDILNAKQPVFSFEFFPPKTENGELSLFRAIAAARDLGIDFVSVTCGAGGSTRRDTTAWSSKIEREIGLSSLAHLTGRGLSLADLRQAIVDIRELGIENVLALRGDEAGVEGGIQFAAEVVAQVRELHPQACIGAACYPEGHIESASRKADLESLKAKVDAGADFLITQLFFDNRHYFEFVGRARSLGITQPILPGIMPIQNVAQIKRFTTLCGASLPDHLRQLLEQYQSYPAAVFHIGVAHAIAQSAELIENGAPGVHFYTLNKSPATRQVVEALKA